MNSKGNAPTMKDVAREAGVALGTVSKVFNGIAVGESYRYPDALYFSSTRTEKSTKPRCHVAPAGLEAFSFVKTEKEMCFSVEK